MNRGRMTIGRLLLAIMFFGVIFAGLRSGSNDWFKLNYTLTFISLVYAAIATRYRGVFWYGFAVAGWAYFIVGFGPWIGSPPGSEPLETRSRTIVGHHSESLDFEGMCPRPLDANASQTRTV
jgi:hypothetical protein